MGDFNILVTDLDLSGFPKLCHARAIQPGGVEFTCAQGRGSLIDYVVASVDIADYLRVAKFAPPLQDSRLPCGVFDVCSGRAGAAAASACTFRPALLWNRPTLDSVSRAGVRA
eukprot:1806489-Pyramimonas_sp.AAC.1